MTSSEVEIGVWVEGVQKWVTGVTRRTTCHDVIKALLRAGGSRAPHEDTDDVMAFVIVERWRKVERPLDHEQRILKVWRTWGDTVGEVRFSLRRVKDGEGGTTGDVGGSSGRPERSRRRQKMKSHAHGSRESLQQPKKVAREDPRFSETMERLMRLVVAQGETIQAQLRRLQERENQIEQYEEQMHLLRVQNLGTDYLLHSYLKDEHVEAKDDPGSEEKSNDSGVVTEESGETGLCQRLEEKDAVEDLDGLEAEEVLAVMAKIEEVNTRLLHEEEALSGMITAVTAAHEQQQDEAQLLQQELACVAHIHAQLVADARYNEQTLRDTEVVLWRQRKQLELLLQEDTESELETRALKKHLDYIIHLPPSAFVSSNPKGNSPVDSTMPTQAPPNSRVPPLTSCSKEYPDTSSTRVPVSTVVLMGEDPPPPLPSCPPPLPACPPPIMEEEEDDGDSARTGSLCVSSRSSTSSEASNGSSGISTTTPSTSLTKPSSSSSSSSAAPPPSTSTSKSGEAGGKDTDSTDSNSDTGLSSLHSSSDEGVYVLDTLV